MAPRHKKKNSLNYRLELVRKHNTSAAEAILQSSSLSEIENKALRKNEISQKQTPELEQLIPEDCVCNREAKTFVCIFCKMFSFGRIAETCSIHPNVSGLYFCIFVNMNINILHEMSLIVLPMSTLQQLWLIFSNNFFFPFM